MCSWASEQLGVGHTEPLSFRTFTLAQLGRGVEAHDAMRRLQETVPAAPPLHLALSSPGFGDRAAAMRKIEEGFAQQDVRLVFLAVEQRCKLLGQGAYAKLLKRAGLHDRTSSALSIRQES